MSNRTISFVFSIFLASTLSLPIITATAATFANPATLTGIARQKEIARKVNVLGNLGFGARVHPAMGSTAEEMVRRLAGAHGSIIGDVDFLVDATSNDFDFGDMTRWGTTDLASARELFASGDGSEADAMKEKRRATLGATILGELSRFSGLSFGFTNGSSSYCGVSFMGLLIVDEENKLIYELSLTSSGPC
ncbi:hypothetical protein BH10BDE1_BH10BDE1_34060 [soil metagenome]